MSWTQAVGDGLLVLGVFFALIGSIGVVRLPGFYARTHAASKPDTLGLMLAMLGLALRIGWGVTAVKLLLIAVFVLLANPAAAHALGRSARRSGLVPWKRGEGPR